MRHKCVGIALAGLASLFAINAFGGEEPLCKEIVDLSIHLMFPCAFIVAALIITRKRELLGGFLWLAIAMLYVRTFGLSKACVGQDRTWQ